MFWEQFQVATQIVEPWRLTFTLCARTREERTGEIELVVHKTVSFIFGHHRQRVHMYSDFENPIPGLFSAFFFAYSPNCLFFRVRTDKSLL